MKMSKRQRYYHHIINTGLGIKYAKINKENLLSSDLVNLQVINRITRPTHFINQNRIAFQQIDIYCKTKEYLKRFYNLEEYVHKNQALTQYYKFHNQYPYHIDSSIGLIMMVYQQANNKQQRKFLKKLMNEPSSVSEDSQSSGSHDSSELKKNSKKQKQYSCKLKQLYIDRSSFLLEQFCTAFNKVWQNKHYSQSFDGQYSDGVKEFKQYLLKNKQSKEQQTAKPNNMKKSTPSSYVFKKKRQLDLKKNQKSQNAPKQSGEYHQWLCTKKFDSNQQFKKTFTNILSLENKSKMGRKSNFSKLKRNKTLSIRPQSFSKTTANDTVSKEDCSQNFSKIRVKSSIRIRKCQSSTKHNTLVRTKSVNKLAKISEIQNRQKENEQNRNRNFCFEIKAKQKNFLIRSNSNTKSKNTLKKEDSKSKIEKGLTRMISKGTVSQICKQNNDKAEFQKSKVVKDLIKNKLKLRA